MNRLLVPATLLCAGCTIAPTPSPWRQRLIDAGVQTQVGSLVVLDEGKGAAVVLLHGLGGSAFDWRHQRGALVAAGFRAIVPDMLGAGYSEKPSADYSVTAQAERILAMMDALGVKRAHLVGNSYGGGVALALALLHPDRVDRLVLVDAAVLPQAFPWYIELARRPVLGPAVFAVAPKRALAGTLFGCFCVDPDSITPKEIDEYAHELRFEGTAGAVRAMACDLDVREAEHLVGRLGEVRAPTLILWGARDRVIPLESGMRLALRIPGATLEVRPDCGHVPHMERPADVTPRLIEFLREP